MKFRKICLLITAVIVALSFAMLSACRIFAPEKSYEQTLDYSESLATIDNPDQGFYRPIFVKVTESGVTYAMNGNVRLNHLRIDISAFSKAVNGEADKPLTKAALDGLDSLFKFLKEKDKNAVVRFAYDPSYGGSKDKEPALQMILKHIEQVCPVLGKYQSTITAIEAGLIGPWGEMHSSAIANAENINPIIGKFLSKTKNIPILVRTPKMIYNYLGITLNDIDDYVIKSSAAAYRLGLFNDGYLGSGNDLGTYTDRQREIEFLSGQTNHLPYGGEVVIPSSGLHDINVCLPEMFKMHLSYLNIEWHYDVINKWKNSLYTEACGSDGIYYGQTAFNYIQNHMGYRFVLEKSVLSYADNPYRLKASLTLKNVGFGNLNKKKRARLIFTDAEGNVVLTKSVKDFTGGESFECSANISLKSGKYEVYLQLYGDEFEGAPRYCLQFANDGLWNDNLKANKIGSMEIA